MLCHAAQVTPSGLHRYADRPQRLPALDLVHPVLRLLVSDADASLDAHFGRVAPGGLDIIPQGADGFPSRFIRRKVGKPAVGDGGDPAQHRLRRQGAGAASRAQPDWDWPLHRQRVDTGVGNPVPLSLKVHHLASPQGPQQRNLFLAAPSPVAEVAVQRLIFHMVPAHANAQPQPASAKQVHLCRLLGDQDGGALRQNQDAGGQPDGLGHGGQISHQGKGFVDDAPVGIVGIDHVGVALRVGSQHMVGNEQVGVTQFLGGQGVFADGSGV